MESSTTVPQPLAPEPPPAPGKPKRVAYAIGAILAVLVVVAALFLIRIEGNSLLTRIFAAIELRSMTVGTSADDALVVHRFGVFGLKPVEIPEGPGSLRSYAEADDADVAAAVYDVDGTQEVYVSGPEPKQLTSDGGVKTGLAVSHDGAWVAYARASSTEAFSATRDAWTVNLANIATGEITELGAGFGPQFFEHEGGTWLLYTAPTEIVTMNVGEMAWFATPLELGGEGLRYAAVVSPDGTHIAFRDADGERFSLYEVYRIGHNVPLGLNPTDEDLSGLIDVVLGKSAVYGTWSPGDLPGYAIHKIGYGSGAAGTQVYYFPATTQYRLLP